MMGQGLINRWPLVSSDTSIINMNIMMGHPVPLKFLGYTICHFIELFPGPASNKNPLCPSLTGSSLHHVYVKYVHYSHNNQSHYREFPRWVIFIEQELRFGLDLCLLHK